MKKIPDFTELRKGIIKGVKFPAAVQVDELSLKNELDKLSLLCGYLNETIKAYEAVFSYTPGIADFKNKILPWVLKQPPEKVLDRMVKTRWLEENKVSIQLNGGLKLDRDAEVDFLLKSIKFPENVENLTGRLHELISKCFVPDVQYSVLYNENENTFEVTHEAKSILQKKHTIFVDDERSAELHILRYQLCDALNSLRNIGYGLIGMNIPPVVKKLLDIVPQNDGWSNGHLFRVNPKKMIKEKSKQLEILSYQDPNKYDDEGKPIDEFQPVVLKTKIDGVPNTVAIKVPRVIIPEYTDENKKWYSAREIAEDPMLLREVVFKGSGIIEFIDTTVLV